MKTGIKTIDNLAQKHLDKIDEVSDERGNGDGIWIYLKPEYANFEFDPLAPMRLIHEQTVLEVVEELKYARKITLDELVKYKSLQNLDEQTLSYLMKTLE
jgi:hypothetical protein